VVQHIVVHGMNCGTIRGIFYEYPKWNDVEKNYEIDEYRKEIKFCGLFSLAIK